jgi:nitroreductase
VSPLKDIDEPAQDVYEAARTRRSIRAYKPDTVPLEPVREILELGRHAPSGSNMQPWFVHVLTGATLKRVSTAIQTAFLTDELGHQRDYEYYTDPVDEQYLARKRQCGWGLYGTLGIARGEREKSKAYRARNYDFFGAPVGLIYTIDRRLEIGSWLDYGTSDERAWNSAEFVSTFLQACEHLPRGSRSTLQRSGYGTCLTARVGRLAGEK